MIAARPLVVIVVVCTLAACTTQTLETGVPPRTVRTAVGSAPPTTPSQSVHGYVEGELLLTFTPEGERTVAPLVGQQANRALRFGVPSLDRLNSKYRARQLVRAVDVHGGYILRIAPDANVFRAVDEYGKDPLVSGADLHYLMRLPPAEAPEAVRTKTGPLRKEDRPVQPPAQ